MRRPAQLLFLGVFLAVLGAEALLRLAGVGPWTDPFLPEPPAPPAPKRLAEALAYPQAWAGSWRMKRWLRIPAKNVDAWWRTHWLGSTGEELSLPGKDGFFFYKGTALDLAREFQGQTALTEAQARLQVRVLQRRAQRLKALGIQYLLVLTPEKQSVYPEALPWGLGLKGERSRERFARRARAAGLDVLDLTPALLEAKRGGRVYHSTDTHWNMRGAYAAYRAILQRWPEAVPGEPWAWDPADEAPSPWTGGDLARFPGFDLLVAEPYSRMEGIHFIFGYGQPSYPPRAGGPVVLLAGDSFAIPLWTLMGRHARRFLHSDNYHAFPWDRVRAERPQVVIEELVERRLLSVEALMVRASQWPEELDAETLALAQEAGLELKLGRFLLESGVGTNLYPREQPEGVSYAWTGPTVATRLMAPLLKAEPQRLELDLVNIAPGRLKDLQLLLNGRPLAWTLTAPTPQAPLGVAVAQVPASGVKAGWNELWVACPVFVPAQAGKGSDDVRSLGVALHAVRLTAQ